MATRVHFKRKLRKTGQSFAVTIPPELLEALGWEESDTLQLSITDTCILIKKLKTVK